MPVFAWSQAVIAFENKTHDFGTIKEADGRVSVDFVFENQGNAPLVISKVQASCGCTTPAWTKSPVEPGQKGKITVTYNPAGRPGNFNKSISVQSNATVERERLIIKGVVIPKAQKPQTVYRVTMGGIRLNDREVEFTNVQKGLVKSAGLKVKNTSGSEVKVSVAGLPPYVTTDATGLTLAANAEQEMKFSFDSKLCPWWGPVVDSAYVVLNGKEERTDVYKLKLSANVVEDFSRMTLEEKRTAPILEMPERTLNLGTFNGLVKRNGTFTIRNVGQRPLEIRRIICDDKEIALKQEQMTIKGGRSAELKFTVDSKLLTAGRYNRAITLQTNDPENVYVVLGVVWNVE